MVQNTSVNATRKEDRGRLSHGQRRAWEILLLRWSEHGVEHIAGNILLLVDSTEKLRGGSGDGDGEARARPRWASM